MYLLIFSDCVLPRLTSGGGSLAGAGSSVSSSLRPSWRKRPPAMARAAVPIRASDTTRAKLIQYDTCQDRQLTTRSYDAPPENTSVWREQESQ